VVRLHKKCGFTVAFTNRDARRSYETWSQNLPQKDDLAWYIAHSIEVAYLEADEYGAQVRLPLGPTLPSYDLQP
jgi:hypothetical protein